MLMRPQSQIISTTNKYQSGSSSVMQHCIDEMQVKVQFQKEQQNMGNCLAPLQHQKNEENTEAPLQLHRRLSLKQQWLQLLLTPEFSHTPSVLNRVRSHLHPSFAQIQKDIDRTYPLEPQFNLPQNKSSFKELLQMIALYYPRLGYIQGMNFIAGYLILVGMSKMQAFNTFRSILFHPELMLIGIYEDDFPLVKVYCAVFWSMFQEQSGEFAAKVKELNLPDELWIFQWFICLFIYSFPRSYVSDILSFIWREKEFACVRLALALIKLLQKAMENKGSFQDEFIQCLQMIKDETYIRKNVPLEYLIREADKIDKRSVQQHLSKITIKNSFSRYFTANQTDKQQLYEQIITEKERDRKEYYSSVYKGQSAQRIRNSSVTIIDDIEQKRAERYYGRIYNSLPMKIVNQSFVKFQRRYSMDKQLQNNAILTESVYQK